MNLQYVAVINDYQTVGYSVKIIFTKDHMILYYIKGLCRLLSTVILLGEGGKEKA